VGNDHCLCDCFLSLLDTLLYLAVNRLIGFFHLTGQSYSIFFNGKELLFMAKKIGLFYGTQTGNTQSAAEMIQASLGQGLMILKPINI